MRAIISYYIRGNNKLRFAQAVDCQQLAVGFHPAG
jgi:hypothetical protein